MIFVNQANCTITVDPDNPVSKFFLPSSHFCRKEIEQNFANNLSLIKKSTPIEVRFINFLNLFLLCFEASFLLFVKLNLFNFFK